MRPEYLTEEALELFIESAFADGYWSWIHPLWQAKPTGKRAKQSFFN